MKEKEEWRDIPGFEGAYQVSSLGPVRSVTRVVSGPRGPMSRTFPGRVLKRRINRHGYYWYTLSFREKNKKTIGIREHRAVAMAFIPNPENKPNINHLDFNPKNNRVENLEWVDQGDNIRYSAKFGRYKKSTEQVAKSAGERCGNSKLTWAAVDKIRKMRTRFSARDLAKMNGVTLSVIHKVLRHELWKEEHRPKS